MSWKIEIIIYISTWKIEIEKCFIFQPFKQGFFQHDWKKAQILIFVPCSIKMNSIRNFEIFLYQLQHHCLD